jgi:hypothetical protein
MLLTIKGLSAEKVAFVIAPGSGYQTPRALYEAFKRDEERERRERLEMERENEMGSIGLHVNEKRTGSGKRKTKKIRLARELLCELGGNGRSKIGSVLSTHLRSTDG